MGKTAELAIFADVCLVREARAELSLVLFRMVKDFHVGMSFRTFVLLVALLLLPYLFAHDAFVSP